MKIKILIIISIVLLSCKTNKFPTLKYYSYSVAINTEYKNDTLFVKINNPLFCPLRFYPLVDDLEFQKKLNETYPIRNDTLRCTTKENGKSYIHYLDLNH